MKATAQHAKTKQPLTQRRNHARVQANARPGGVGNQHRKSDDAFERQAEEIASRIMLGEKNLGRRVMPTAAAGFRATGSNGRLLPQTLREEMESSFGADFRTVRIHTSTAADSAAREHSANAFASGRDIYFCSGHYMPFSSTGKELLAHELTHVLQQTGRVSHDRRLRVEPTASGENGVQCQTDLSAADESARARRFEVNSIANLFSKIPVLQPAKDAVDCKAAVDRHLETSPDNDQLKTLGERIKAAVDGQSLADAATAVDGIFISVVEADRSEAVKALFFDAYKALNQDSKAAAVVGKDVPTQTAFGSWSFYNAKRRKDAAVWLPPLLKAHPVAGEYFLRNIIAVARMDFYGGARGGLSLDMEMKFTEKMGKAMTEALTYQPFMPEERLIAAMRALIVFDAIRLVPFQDLEKETKGIKSLVVRFESKRRLIKKYIDPNFLPTLAADNSSDPEVLVIAKEAGAAIAPIAERAVAFWDKIVPLTRDVIGGPKADEDALRHAMRLRDVLHSKIGSIKEFAGLEKRLIAILDIALRLSGGAVPKPATLAANLATAAAQVKNQAYRLDGALAAREKSIKLTDVPSAQQDTGDDPLSTDTLSDDMAFGVVLYLLFAMQNVLVQYEAPKPKKDEGDRILDQDSAVKTMLGVARGFANLGVILGYNNLASAAQDAQFAAQPGLKKSFIGLLAPFDQTPATLSEFQRDFPKDDIADNVLGGTSLIQSVFALYYENFLGNLNNELNAKGSGGTAREFDYDLNKKAIVTAAIEATEKSFKPPRKYRVPRDSTIMYLRPGGDRGRAYDFVTPKHPYVLKLVSESKGENETAIAPGNISVHNEGFVIWILPDMDQVVDKLKYVPGIDQVKRKDGKSLGMPSEYLTPMGWLEELDKAASKNDAVRKQLADTIKAWMMKAFHDLDAPLRRATNNERRKVGPLIAEQWEKLTKRFLDSPNTYFEAPRQAQRYTLTFVGNIQPVTEAEQKLQMTGLMLELAPVLSRKLGESTSFGGLIVSTTDRLDIILPLHAHLEGAAKLAADATSLAALQTLNLSFPLNEIADRAAKLKALADQFRATAEEYKASRLVEGVVADRMLHVPDRGHALTAKKDENDKNADDFFQVEGVIYQLTKVHRNFVYQPELLSMASGIRWSGEDLSNRRLWVDGVELKPDALEVPLLTIMRTPNGGEPKEIVVTSSNTAMLSELTYALDLHITLENLATLGTILEGYASVITLAIQLAFPEFATEIAVAEVTGSVIQFLGGPEFAMMRSMLDSGAGTLFNQGLQKISDQLTPDALWDYMLFDIKPSIFDTLGTVLGLTGQIGAFNGRKRNSDKAKSSIWKVIGRLIRVVGELVEAFTGVHDHVSFPFRKVSLYVQGSPWLSLLLRFVANNLYRLEGMSLRELGVEEAVEMITEVQQMYLRFETVVKGLGEYELPEELVPIPAILDMLVNLLFDHLPLKYRIAAKGVKSQTQKLFDWLEEKAGKALKDNGVDPNRIWRDYAAKKINPYIQGAGKEVSKEIEGVLNKVPFLHDLATINVPALAAKFTEREVVPAPEPKPKLEAGITAPLAAPSLPGSAGAPLSGSARSQAQRGFGHDFSHVRMHRDTAVDTSLRASGAHAATLGSHVYLDSGISTSTLDGRDVLNHELSHVLQQTGARPLGLAHSDAPLIGSGGGGSSRSGWSFNPSDEAQADSLAQAARLPAATPRPVTSARGLQPSLYDVVNKLFLELGDPRKLQENAKEMIAHPVKDTELGQAAPGLKDNFAEKLFLAMKKPTDVGSVVSYTAPFDGAGDALLEYVKNNSKKDIEAGLPHVLDAGLHKVEPKGQDPFWILVPGRVETALEEFFFGVSGVSVDIEFNTRKQKGPDDKERTIIDPDNPFAKIKFNYVHLPTIGGSAKIWSDVIANTFPTAGAKASLYQANARLVLRGLKPGPGIFTTGKRKSGKTLIFARKTRELIESYVNPPPQRDLPGDAVPKWTDYIKPDSQPPTTGKIYGQIGLRLGLYKDRENLNEQKGTDRASHHTVQYLLLEYLVNSKDRVKPFPNDLSLYPNLKHTGSRVDVIAKTPGSDSGINVSVNDKDRGGTMPTILLSVHTHTLGKVHISPKADDVEGTVASQGSAIHGEFKRFLGAYEPIVMGKAQPLTAMAKKEAGKNYQEKDIPKIGGTKEATQGEMSTAIYNAACKTYTWMRDHMNAKLEHALDDQEIYYYQKLVETATNTSIYNKEHGGAQPGYVSATIGRNIRAEVLKRQVAVFQSSAFGFEAKNP